MQPTDPAIVWLEEKPLGLAERLFLPLFVQGLTTTARHLVSPKVTVSFPEQRPQVGNPLIYRGVHRLNRDAEGRGRPARWTRSNSPASSTSPAGAARR